MRDIEEKKIIDRINKSYDDNTQYVEASAKDWNYIVHSIRKLHEEIEEKNTIIMAGAKKVKQLEKEIEAKEMEHQYDQNMIDDLKGEMVHDWIHKDKIRRIINKYVDIDEHLKYNNQELYGEDLKNMINELL